MTDTMSSASSSVELALTIPSQLPPPPLSPPTIEQHEDAQQTHYVAVRRGQYIRNCIFNNWDDAKEHLEAPDAQYSVFESLHDAIKYAFNIDLQAIDGGMTNASESRDIINDTILAESMAAENLMEQILPSSSTTNLLRMPQAHDDFISLAHDAASDMNSHEHDSFDLSDAEEHSLNNRPIIQATDTFTSAVAAKTNQAATSETNQSTPSKSGTQKRGVKRNRGEETGVRETKRELDWMAKYTLLADYAAQHGNCAVPTKPENSALTTWINNQRIEYRKLQATDTCKLSASQVQKLNDVGFKFTVKRNYASWEHRMGELKAFNEAHGHARVPVNHPTLGSWVHDQRRDYKRYIQNDPKTKMTQERLQQLLDIGFIFEVAKKSQQYDARSNSKSWDERFDELKEFKETFGHTIVPQHYPNLGWWVNTQRKEHRKLKTGKKASLTVERCLKLTEIGFVFDASNKRGSTNYAYTTTGGTTANHHDESVGQMQPENGYESIDLASL